jgi:hypothetical protein
VANWPIGARSGRQLAVLGGVESAEWSAAVTQAGIEFKVADVAAAAEELKAKGYRLIHAARTEPWGQVTARHPSPPYASK